ncbi:chemotaxis protein CheB [Mycobacterium sp. 1274756.6]|uniref:chemotaxis protein CheB n=1 Tax=Mycobacterium sp. 1274756.6 TaxID=1834076 RepID=UPI0007FEB162|nr:hypothetical protein A5643_06635 [Mycobacterium sp. 1274756.6]
MSRDSTVDDTRRIVAVGASAGGVAALSRFVAGLPADLPHPVLVALHLPVGASSVLARVLDRRGRLPARTAADIGELLARLPAPAPAEHAITVLGNRLSDAARRPEQRHA